MTHSQTYTQRQHINMDRIYHPSTPNGNQRHSPKVTDHSWIQYNSGSGRPTTSSPGSLSQHSLTTINKNNKSSNTSTTVQTVFQSSSYDVQQHSMNLSQHIYQRGLLESIGSDVIVKIPAWQREYHLHRLILDQNPYFQTLFQGGFLETATNEITLHFEGHSYITADSFQFVLAQLYGKVGDPDINLDNIQSILATCSFFQLDSMCELCVEFILQSLSEYTVVDYLLFVDAYLVFGSDKICDAIFTFLCREAYTMDPKCLVDIPAAWFKKITHSDSFWVPSEYHRYQFIKNVIQQIYTLCDQQKQLSTTSEQPTHQSQKSHSMEYMGYTYDDNDIILSNEDDYKHVQNTSDSESDSSTSSSSSSSISIIPPSSTTQSNKRDQSTSSSLTTPKELTDTIETFDNILSHSIHYIHMTFEQLNAIRHDTNPFDNKPMVPDSIIKDALWNQIQIRAKIEGAMEDEKVLNLTMADPSSSTTNKFDQIMDTTPYAIPTNDITTYTGESATTSNRNLYYKNHHQQQQQHLHSSIPSPSTSPSIQDQSNSSTPVSISTTPDTLQYAQHPPFRFSVEFKDVVNLKRNVRVYSKSVFYAGSNWNMYIQKTKSQRKGKGVLQLGVYLHRQSTPFEIDQQLATANSYQSTYSSSQNDPTISHHRHTDNNSNNSYMDPSSSFSQYSDKRLVTKTWFKIFCPSRGPKHTLTLFQSTPDDFSVLQSWGWRSTVLCADETNNINNCNNDSTATITTNDQQIRNNTFDPSSSQSTHLHHLDPTVANPPPGQYATQMASLSLSNSSFGYRTRVRPSETMPYESDTTQRPRCTSSVGSTLRFSVVMGHV